MVKKAIKNIIGGSLSSFNYPLVINSYGRSGSTVLTHSIVQYSIKTQFINFGNIADRTISQEAWDLKSKNLKDGIVYKTHDYPSDSLDNYEKIRMLYTFANPVDVILSLLRLFEKRGEEWIKQHYQHLGASYTNSFENIIYEDQLNLEKHLDTWLDESRFPIAFIRYETMWEYQNEISEYLGFSITLPKYKTRKSNHMKESRDLEDINKTYKKMKSKIDNLENFFINKSE